MEPVRDYELKAFFTYGVLNRFEEILEATRREIEG
jgi:hypothetical protein